MNMENIAYTVQPPIRLTQEEWMEEFKVGRLVQKKCSNAEKIMKQWENDKPTFIEMVGEVFLD